MRRSNETNGGRNDHFGKFAQDRLGYKRSYSRWSGIDRLQKRQFILCLLTLYLHHHRQNAKSTATTMRPHKDVCGDIFRVKTENLCEFLYRCIFASFIDLLICSNESYISCYDRIHVQNTIHYNEQNECISEDRMGWDFRLKRKCSVYLSYIWLPRVWLLALYCVYLHNNKDKENVYFCR